MKVHWTQNAIEHLIGIFQYISINSPSYATITVDRITRRSEQISDYPYSGRKVPEYDRDDIRELIENPYRMIYRIKQDQIDILALIHGSRQLPANVLSKKPL